MLDLPGFWSGWVIALTLAGLAWLTWLLFSVYFGRRAREAEAAETELVWDEGLREGAAAPPLWWFWLLLGMLSFSAAYLILYPGLGGMRGALEWTQAGQLRESAAADAEKHGATRERWREASLEDLAGDETAMRVARRIYRGNCAACHGEDARGQAKRFPDLTDTAWQWGDDGGGLRFAKRRLGTTGFAALEGMGGFVPVGEAPSRAWRDAFPSRAWERQGDDRGRGFGNWVGIVA